MIVFCNETTEKLFDVFDKMVQHGYENREGQQNMSFDILDSIREDKKYIVIEAGVRYR